MAIPERKTSESFAVMPGGIKGDVALRIIKNAEKTGKTIECLFDHGITATRNPRLHRKHNIPNRRRVLIDDMNRAEIVIVRE
ncbi:MAG: hypothetical protein M1524_01595 [Patescibacteria group bacterium]|nr:hypothetical protein [Patescibacteria group bacterium]